MPKEKWYHAKQVESNPKTPLENHEINAESYNLPVLTVEIGESDQVEDLTADFLKENLELAEKIETENLDIVAHEVKNAGGKKKWVLIIGFGFAAIGLGVAGYKLIHKYKKPVEKK